MVVALTMHTIMVSRSASSWALFDVVHAVSLFLGWGWMDGWTGMHEMTKEQYEKAVNDKAIKALEEVRADTTLVTSVVGLDYHHHHLCLVLLDCSRFASDVVVVTT